MHRNAGLAVPATPTQCNKAAPSKAIEVVQQPWLQLASSPSWTQGHCLHSVALFTGTTTCAQECQNALHDALKGMQTCDNLQLNIECGKLSTSFYHTRLRITRQLINGTIEQRNSYVATFTATPDTRRN
jgi:hypothetical protein